MNELLQAILGVLVGGFLGLVYFTGLWWTVRRLPTTAHVWRLYFGSLLVRLAIVLGSFYWLLRHSDWPAWVACLAGFALTRWILVRFLGHTTMSMQATE